MILLKIYPLSINLPKREKVKGIKTAPKIKIVSHQVITEKMSLILKIIRNSLWIDVICNLHPSIY